MDGNPAAAAKRQARRAAHEAAPWVEGLARLGYAARGIVYLIVGVIAARAALGSGRVQGSEGALATMLRQPLGKVMLAAMAVGLIGYALWRFVQATMDPEGKGSDAKGMVARAAYAVSGAVHVGLALAAARMAMGSQRGSGGDGAQHWTSVLMEQPAGRWLVVLVGAVIGGYGVYELYRAATSDPAKRLGLSSLAPDTRTGVVRAARAGMVARGVVFCIIALFLVRAALQHDASEARGLEGTLRTLQQQAYGPWLLGAVALGLICYGVFELVKARYRRIHPA